MSLGGRRIIKKKSEGGGTRTHDLGIKSPLLYQLSYATEVRLRVREISYPAPPAATCFSGERADQEAAATSKQQLGRPVRSQQERTLAPVSSERSVTIASHTSGRSFTATPTGQPLLWMTYRAPASTSSIELRPPS